MRLEGGRTDDDVFVASIDEPITGRPLRVLIVDLLVAHRAPRSIRQIVQELDSLHTPFGARPSKAISDALRWEVRRGRVESCGRGVYRFVGAPPTTVSRIRRRARSVRRHLEQRDAPSQLLR